MLTVMAIADPIFGPRRNNNMSSSLYVGHFDVVHEDLLLDCKAMSILAN